MYVRKNCPKTVVESAPISCHLFFSPNEATLQEGVSVSPLVQWSIALSVFFHLLLSIIFLNLNGFVFRYIQDSKHICVVSLFLASNLKEPLVHVLNGD